MAYLKRAKPEYLQSICTHFCWAKEENSDSVLTKMLHLIFLFGLCSAARLTEEIELEINPMKEVQRYFKSAYNFITETAGSFMKPFVKFLPITKVEYKSKERSKDISKPVQDN